MAMSDARKEYFMAEEFTSIMNEIFVHTKIQGNLIVFSPISSSVILGVGLLKEDVSAIIFLIPLVILLTSMYWYEYKAISVAKLQTYIQVFLETDNSNLHRMSRYYTFRGKYKHNFLHRHRVQLITLSMFLGPIAVCLLLSYSHWKGSMAFYWGICIISIILSSGISFLYFSENSMREKFYNHWKQLKKQEGGS